MINWYNSEDVRALDARLIASGTPGYELMKRVGSGIAQEILFRYTECHTCLVCAGAGNNGGDGFVIASCLAAAGWHVDVVLSHAPERSRGDAALALEAMRRDMRREKIAMSESAALSDAELKALMMKNELIVDALLGTGAAGSPRGETARLISLMNACKRPVIAVDMPSGVEGDAECVRAELTCTAGARKIPLATGNGAGCCGEIVLIPLADGAQSLLPKATVCELEQNDLQGFWPERRPTDHKGNRGGVLIIAGSRRYRGAALLAARGALRMGSGLVVLASVPDVLTAATVALPEVITEELKDETVLDTLFQRWAPRCQTLMIGSGLDRDERAQKLCACAARSWQGSSVWDGDGLYWLAHDHLCPRRYCVTPHEGEAQTLLMNAGCSVDGVKASALWRLNAAREICLAENCRAALLKGFRSVLASHDGLCRVVPKGNYTLAIPGSGDVLAGAAAAALSALRRLGGSHEHCEMEALTVAAWCHGAAGERLGALRGCDGILAHEIADELPLILHELKNNKSVQGAEGL